MSLILRRDLFLPIALVVVQSVTFAAQSVTGGDARERGIAMVQQGNTGEAIVLLKGVLKQNKRDVRAWHWLGVALEKQQQVKDASKAHEAAVRTAEDLQSPLAEQLKSLGTIELSEAADSGERYLALNHSLSDKKREEWRDRVDLLKLYATSGGTNAKIYRSDEVTTRPRVLRKPEPEYTDDARANKTRGVVVLRCIFTADGRVRNIGVIKGLPDGLTERAIDVARQIKFIPATKDGKPVAIWMQLEYNFEVF